MKEIKILGQELGTKWEITFLGFKKKFNIKNKNQKVNPILTHIVGNEEKAKI
jgi:hypothetical protein